MGDTMSKKSYAQNNIAAEDDDVGAGNGNESSESDGVGVADKNSSEAELQGQAETANGDDPETEGGGTIEQDSGGLDSTLTDQQQPNGGGDNPTENIPNDLPPVEQLIQGWAKQVGFDLQEAPHAEQFDQFMKFLVEAKANALIENLNSDDKSGGSDQEMERDENSDGEDKSGDSGDDNSDEDDEDDGTRPSGDKYPSKRAGKPTGQKTTKKSRTVKSKTGKVSSVKKEDTEAPAANNAEIKDPLEPTARHPLPTNSRTTKTRKRRKNRK